MDRKYQVVCYLRIEPEDQMLLTYEEALQDKNQLELMQPENIYKIEKIKDNDHQPQGNTK
jgi:hypothetical protein